MKRKSNKVKGPVTSYEIWKNRIEINPDIKGGKPVIRGTRVPVEIVLGSLAAGMSFEEICASYVISTEDIKACLAFSAAVLSEEKFFAISR